jgi:hypothetical protein
LASTLAARLKARKEGGSAAVASPPAMPTSLPPSLPYGAQRVGPVEDRHSLQAGADTPSADPSSAASINAFGAGLGGFSYGGAPNGDNNYGGTPSSPPASRALDFTNSAYGAHGSPQPSSATSPTSDYLSPNGNTGDQSSGNFSSHIPPSAATALLTSILTRLPARAEASSSNVGGGSSSGAPLSPQPSSPLQRSQSPPPSSSPTHHSLGGATLGRTSSQKKTPTKPAMIKRVSPTATGTYNMVLPSFFLFSHIPSFESFVYRSCRS